MREILMGVTQILVRTSSHGFIILINNICAIITLIICSRIIISSLIWWLRTSLTSNIISWNRTLWNYTCHQFLWSRNIGTIRYTIMRKWSIVSRSSSCSIWLSIGRLGGIKLFSRWFRIIYNCIIIYLSCASWFRAYHWAMLLLLFIRY